MKKFTKITLITAICLLSVGIVLASAGLLSGANLRNALGSGMWDTMIHTHDNYLNDYHSDNSYAIESAENVRGIAVDWICGNIDIVSYDGDTILLKENADELLDEDTCLRYRIENGTLYIESSRNFMGIGFSGDNSNLEKHLTIEVPQAMADRLEDISVDAVDSDITATGFTLHNLEIDTTSGHFYGRDLSVREVEMDTVSGSMQTDFRHCPDEISFSSTSGSCMLGLPEDSDAYIEYDTGSGCVYNHFGKHKKHGKGYSQHHSEGAFSLGSGSHCNMDLETISGDIRIYKGSCF